MNPHTKHKAEKNNGTEAPGPNVCTQQIKYRMAGRGRVTNYRTRGTRACMCGICSGHKDHFYKCSDSTAAVYWRVLPHSCTWRARRVCARAQHVCVFMCTPARVCACAGGSTHTRVDAVRVRPAHAGPGASLHTLSLRRLRGRVDARARALARRADPPRALPLSCVPISSRGWWCATRAPRGRAPTARPPGTRTRREPGHEGLKGSEEGPGAGRVQPQVPSPGSSPDCGVAIRLFNQPGSHLPAGPPQAVGRARVPRPRRDLCARRDRPRADVAVRAALQHARVCGSVVEKQFGEIPVS
jgi:hypothetical protein